MKWWFSNSQVAIGKVKPYVKCGHEFRLDEDYLMSCKFCGIVFDVSRNVLETKEVNKRFYDKLWKLDKVYQQVNKINRSVYGKKRHS